MGEAHVPAEQPQAGQEPRLPAPHVDPGRAGDHRSAAPEGPQAPVGLTWRIRDRATFRDLHQRGRRVRRGPVTVTWVSDAAGSPPRVAYVVGRKTGGAVVRNRIRRRLRAAVAGVVVEPGAYLLGGDVAVATMPWGELRTLVHDAVRAVTTPGRSPGAGPRPAGDGAPAGDGPAITGPHGDAVRR